MGQTTDNRQSFFRSIAKDKTANTIAISAASLVPLMAMVGGGVDASRYYMAETRLQSACDAGALASRRAMDDLNFTSEHRQIGENFFDQNYEDGLLGTEGLSRSYSATADGEVNGVATGTLPTSIMGAFGYDEFELAVDCTADINISNSDIMFVVDVTGSMNCAPDNPNGGACNNTEAPDAKIRGLRTAVMTFYDTVQASTSPNAQVRYGMVPYASNVNVGNAVVDENQAWMAQSHTYQSREADPIITVTYEPETYTYTRTGDAFGFDFQGRVEENDYGVTTFNDCVALINTRQDIFVTSSEASWTQVSQSGSDPRVTVYDGIVTYESYTFDGGTYFGSADLCRLYYNHNEYDAASTITVTEGRVETEEFRWAYRPVEWSLAGLYDDNRTVLPLGANGSDIQVTWDGCIEEARSTNPNSVTATTFNPNTPADAFDLDINLRPATDDQRWAPVLDEVVWKRENGNNNTQDEIFQFNGENDERRAGYSCPAEAFRLTDINRGDMQNFVNSLRGRSNTYHDIGMIWGARFLSPNGIFEADNTTAPNGDAISRHLVFMTDGLLVPSVEVYGTYGIEWWDRRVTGDSPSNGLASTRHAERFQAACRAARQENISVWVIAFGTALSQNLIDCATPGRAFVADDSDELRDRFQEIAQRIAALRLTQ